MQQEHGMVRHPGIWRNLYSIQVCHKFQLRLDFSANCHYASSAMLSIQSIHLGAVKGQIVPPKMGYTCPWRSVRQPIHFQGNGIGRIQVITNQITMRLTAAEFLLQVAPRGVQQCSRVIAGDIPTRQTKFLARQEINWRSEVGCFFQCDAVRGVHTQLFRRILTAQSRG